MPAAAGPPTWSVAPTLAAGPEVPAGEATLIPELWSLVGGAEGAPGADPGAAGYAAGGQGGGAEVGARIRVRCVEVEDADWDPHRPAEELLSVEEIEAVVEVLVSGRDRAVRVPAWGRVYTRTWSLDPPGAAFPAGEFLWFYPMTEARRLSRVPRAPLAGALLRCLGWLRARTELAPDSAAVLGRLVAGLRRGA